MGNVIHSITLLLLSSLMTGCIVIDKGTTYDDQYHAMEHGQPQTFRVVEIWSHSAVVIGAGRRDTVFVENAPKPNDWWQFRKLRDETPADRRLENIWERILYGTGVGFHTGSKVNVLWIISNAPLVVAVGIDEIVRPEYRETWPYINESTESSHQVRLIIDANLDRLAKGLILIDRKAPKTLNFDHSLPLRELLEPAKWSENFEKLSESRPASNPPDFSSPAATYRTYLLAIKADDEPAAKACWWISDNNRSGALDVVVGMHAAHHRCAGLLVKRFGEAANPYLEEIPQFTDVTVDRELKELPQAKIQITGDTATVTFPDYPHDFRKIGGLWKIDFNATTGLKDPADFFEPGSWGPGFAAVVRVMRELSDELECGNYKTIEEFKAGLESKKTILEASKPHEK